MAREPVALRVTGLAELRRELGRLADGKAWTAEFRVAGKEAVGVLVPPAKAFAPKRSGDLAASIRALAQGSAFAVAAGKASVPYAGVIHWGWPSRGITAQPFLTRAVQANEPQLITVFMSAIDRVTRKAFPGR